MNRPQARRPVALVTGGGRRLGRQIALALAGDGYDVVVNFHESTTGARKTVRDIEKMGNKAIAVRADVSKKKEVTSLTAATIRKFGRIDLLVNNAARFVNGSILDTSESTWNAIMNINLKGIFLCSQAVAPIMLKQKVGQIINIVSLGGIQAWSKHLAYSVSKAGAIMLTKCMAKSLAPTIRVNAIAPGTIVIEGEEDPAIHHVSRNTIPLQRYGVPSDIIDTVLFLARKGGYMTGQVFVVDGGRSIQ